jgi:hypothetical protein
MPSKDNLIRYRFSSDKEPSDTQLRKIMKEVSVDVKKRHMEASRRFEEELRTMCLSKRK